MFKQWLSTINEKRAVTIIGRISGYVSGEKTIIDIGSGTGHITRILRSDGYEVTPVDVASFHGLRVVKPIIYDGSILPFPDKSFDVALLLTVMHHIPNPENILKEAIRVAKSVVVIETSYTGLVSKLLTVMCDTLANLQIKAYWNSYRSSASWRKLFQQMDLHVQQEKQCHDDQFLRIPFLHVVYWLRPNELKGHSNDGMLKQ